MSRERMQPPHILREQKILNFHWPQHPRSFHKHHPGYRVRARIVWERDGVEFMEGIAKRWDAHHVYVELPDVQGRINTTGAWLKPADVYRAEPEEADEPPTSG